MKNKLLMITIGLLFVVASFLIYKKLNPPKLPSYLIEGIGKINGDLINLNTKYPGRISKIFIDDGEKIKKNEIIAILDSKEYQEDRKNLIYKIKAKKIEVKKLDKELNNLIKIAQYNLNISNIKLNELNYKIDELKSIIAQDKRDYKRTKKLYQENVTKKHNFEMAQLKLKTDIDKINSLYQNRKALKENIKISQQNLKITQNKLKNLDILSQEIKSLEAEKKKIDIIIDELTIKSPINGFVDEKIANIGEVLPAGGIIATLINPKSYYLSVFVDELNNGKIKLGDKAEIFLDNDLNHPIPAQVVSIAQKAEFTPKEVAVRSDRITRVYEVHLKPLKPNPLLKLGLPAIGIILIDKNKTLPKNLKNLPIL